MQTQGPAPVTYRVQDAVATITMTTPSLARPAKAALRAAVEQAAADVDVRAVVLTGSGRVFCAGQDLGEHAAALQQPGLDPFDTIDEHYNPVVTALATMAKPVIAAVNGSCAGAGLGLALACDLRIAAQTARFTTAFTAIGLTPDSGLSLTLQRAVGAARAGELVLLAEPFSAADALAWGIVTRVVATDELPTAAQELGVRLADGPTRAYATAKAALRDASALTLPQALAAERRDQSALGATTDHREAVEAFLAKRRPAFPGRAVTGSGMDAEQVPGDDAVTTMMRADRASAALGIDLLDHGPGWARTAMTVRADMVNGHEIAHGGLLFTLADTAFACACNSWGPVTVAAGAEIVFVAPGRLGDRLQAHAQARTTYGRHGVYDVTVRRGDEVLAEFRGRSHQLAPPR